MRGAPPENHDRSHDPSDRHPPSAERSESLLPGRIPVSQFFPAGLEDHRTAMVTLAGGERVRVVESGPANGPPVVFIHGWGCSAYEWRRNLGPVGAAGWRAIAVDLRGHGLSDKPRGAHAYTNDAMARHLIAILDALGLARTVLVAHSLGGEIAFEVALRAPQRVSRLVLIGPVGFGRAMLARIGKLLTPRPIVGILPSTVTRASVWVALRYATGNLGGVTDEDIAQYWAPSQFPEYSLAIRHLLHGCLWRPRRPHELSRVRVPTLVVFGTRDRLVNGSTARHYVERMPNARLELIDEAGHVVPSEAAERFNTLLLDFLGKPKAG